MIEEGVGDVEVDKIFRSNGVTIFDRPDQDSLPHSVPRLILADNLTGGTMIKNPTAKTWLRLRSDVRRLGQSEDTSLSRPLDQPLVEVPRHLRSTEMEPQSAYLERTLST